MVAKIYSVTQKRFERLCLQIGKVPDPEIPVITIKDLGILRDISLLGSTVTINITPTYSGCPAIDMIKSDIHSLKNEYPDFDLRVKIVLDPAWSTDNISQKGRVALEHYGITPPQKNNEIKFIRCPKCRSVHTSMVSEFSSTACKAMMRCLTCKEPFEYFKSLQ